MSPPATAPLMTPDVAAFIGGGLSITLASCDSRLVPSIAKGVGCRVAEDRSTLTVFVFAESAEATCRDVAANGRIAVTFSRPSTHETIQIKGNDARTVPLLPGDVACVRRNLDRFAEDITPLGWGPDFIDAVFWRDPAELIAIRFTPDGVFGQTPGPRAGEALARRA
ncbi:hypothetical protein GCM10025771_07760 [Niveibacterium umoris]|uniref:Pyridoxamine 5'-phosphate oxidase putative domain-containing protein n=1 Tax=Niveibacterium umoris TaxID=1193620 RepID=A0A840BTJ7_9RHOO|nr:hypothetical protein [Niveibacterium umoris]MBB4013677.1 hypothetical protein [Niveibacterium umoris]